MAIVLGFVLLLLATPAAAQVTWQATLQWTDNAADETGRRVERRDGPASAPWVSQGDVPLGTAVFQQGGLAANQTYCYRTVVLRGADATPSTPTCGTTGSATPPPAADTGFILTYTPGSQPSGALQFRQPPSGAPTSRPMPTPQQPRRP